MPKTLLVRKFFKNKSVADAAFLLVAQGVFILATLYINYWINHEWNAEGFAIFNLVKRLASFMVFPLLVGTGIGIPRYISLLEGNRSSEGSEYLIAGCSIFLATFLMLTAIVFTYPNVILLAFENVAAQKLVLLSLLIYVFSQGFYALINSYYRGFPRFEQMCYLNIGIMSVIPFLTLWFTNNIFNYFILSSSLSLGTLILVVWFIYRKTHFAWKGIIKKQRLLVKYGAPRILADLGLFSLEIVPIYLISVWVGLEQSGYLSMALILIKLVSVVFETLSSMILPYFGRIFRVQEIAVFVLKTQKLILAGFILSLVVGTVFYFLIPVFIESFFPNLAEAIFYSRIILLSFPVYVVYLLLRNILDILSEKAYNSFTLIIASVAQLVVLAVGFYLNQPLIYISLSIVVPYLILGFASFFVWDKLKKRLIELK